MTILEKLTWKTWRGDRPAAEPQKTFWRFCKMKIILCLKVSSPIPLHLTGFNVLWHCERRHRVYESVSIRFDNFERNLLQFRLLFWSFKSEWKALYLWRTAAGHQKNRVIRQKVKGVLVHFSRKNKITSVSPNQE